MRKISPFSPHTMLYRIIVSPADAPKNQFTEIFQNDSLEELNKCMENIKKGNFIVIRISYRKKFLFII
jgi:hypothetical protein